MHWGTVSLWLLLWGPGNLSHLQAGGRGWYRAGRWGKDYGQWFQNR